MTRSNLARSIIFTVVVVALALVVPAGCWRGRSFSAYPMPAQQMTPPMGFLEELAHLTVLSTAEAIDSVEETSVVKKAVAVRFEIGEEVGGGLRSRRAM